MTTNGAPRPVQPPWPEETIKTFGFDSGYARIPWRTLALNEDNATLLESWSGYALSRAADQEKFLPAPVIIPALASEKERNFAPAAGAIRFWFAPNWSTASKASGGTGPGHAARLLELVHLNSQKAHTRWALFFNESGDTLCLAGETKAGAEVLLKAPVEFTAGDWRMISLCYSETNVLLQLDTETIAKAGGLVAPAAWEEKDLGLVIGSDLYASADSLAGGQFEEVITKRHWPVKMDWQEMYFKSGKRRSLLGPQGTKKEEQTKVATLKSAGLLPEEYGMETQSLVNGGGTMAYSYAAGTLWLEITGVSNNLAHLIVHGTVTDMAYEILSKESLTNAEWSGEVPIAIGAAGQDWTATTVVLGTRTNNLFFWARVLSDVDGDGLPDWWELAHGLDPNNPDTGNTGVPDGYKDSDNDGWMNLQEYQNGTSPSQFNTPAVLQWFMVQTDASGTHAKLTWSPAQGPVTGYTIQRGSDNAFISVGSSTFSFVDTQEILPTGWYEDSEIPHYRIRMEYSGGSSSWTTWQNVTGLNSPVAQIISGADGGARVVVGNIPAAAAFVRVGNVESSISGYYFTNSVDIPVTQFTNGAAALSAAFVQTSARYEEWAAQFILTNTASGAIRSDWYDFPAPKPFWDGRAQLKDNLRFQLRIPNLFYSFPYWQWPISTYQALLTEPANYAYSSYYDIRAYSDTDIDQYLNPQLPYEENYRFRNYVIAITNLNTFGLLDTGVDIVSGRFSLPYDPLFLFSAPAAPTPITSLLTTNQTRWLTFLGFDPQIFTILSSGNEELGVLSTEVPPGDYLLSMVSGARNWFGLPYESYLLAWSNSPTSLAVLSPDHDVLVNTSSSMGYFYPEPAQPAFQTEEYYYTRVFNEWQEVNPPMPGYPYFDPTNTTPNLFITSVGAMDFQLAGFAKQAVLNGYAGVYGYLGQYFDKAYTTTNGVVTTNQTGILSPYGEFFPTEPGRTALVTMPDIETGERGTATVYVVSMNLDANHDGTMDRTFFGPDQTFASRPFQFWINNDNDAADYSNGHEINITDVPDNRDNEAKSKRDLEDFARLWISGMPPLPAGQGYTVTLSSSQPGLQLFPAYEADGGISYLTNTTTAANQITSGSRLALGRIAPGTNYVFPDGYFATYERKHFLFEGVTAGAGAVTLTIAQGTNILAATSVFIELQDVKDLYERAVITNNFAGAISNWATGIYTVEQPHVLPQDESQDTFVYLHGGNNTVAEWLMRSDTLFKRLYWSGYHGKFATARWPSPKFVPYPEWFNMSEVIGYKSAFALQAYMAQLQTRFPSNRVHLFAQSLGGAIASEALSLGASADTFILSQVSMSAGCYAVNAPTNAALVNVDIGPNITPNWHSLGYRGAHTNTQARLVNLYNPNDDFLTLWYGQQYGFKPNAFYSYNGTNCWYLIDGDLGLYRQVTDSQESRAMIARSRTLAIGSIGLTSQGVINESIDLQAQFNIGASADEHSAFFTRPIQTIRPYYLQILDAIAP